MSDKVRGIIAGGIGNWLASYGDAYSYHEPHANWRALLDEQAGDVDKVSEYIMQGLKENGIVGFVDQNATRVPRAYTDADAEAWSDHD